MTDTATHFGYYLHKDGTPTVVENTPQNILQLKQNGYWSSAKAIFDEDGIKQHLSTYNAGFFGKRVSIKPFYPIT